MRFPGCRFIGSALGLGLTLSLYVASPASAERDVHHDPAGDVVRFTRNDAQVPATGTRDMDVRRTVVSHTVRRVTIRLRIADLRASTSHYSLSSIKTDALTYGVEYYRLFGADAPSQLVLTDASGARMTCPGRTKRFSASRDEVGLSFPRACLGDPRWVRVSSGWYTIGNRDRIFGDDPRQVGGFPEGRGQNYSRRLQRG